MKVAYTHHVDRKVRRHLILFAVAGKAANGPTIESILFISLVQGVDGSMPTSHITHEAFERRDASTMKLTYNLPRVRASL
jgi:hypothetical protein